ncbi:hypothetical protein EGH22_19740 [Halomicroarcula sp. F28]|uniref:hypothetical protein n=1 Tax=Haloarcula salinisoli TaxID=2487746 RepID=UPI001C73BC35|nr:hypothetical protein [Halomicroarcula salinisoli]MBX0288567.1 hypothetical protein [Halomicroarcula salinisoli]
MRRSERGTVLQGSDLRDAAVIMRTELRARLRKMVDSRRQLVGLVITVIMFGVAFPLTMYGPATGFGGALASGTPPVGRIGAVLTGVSFIAAYFGSATALNQNQLGDVGPLLQTAVAPAAVSLGRFVNEVLQSVAFLVPPLLVLLVLVALGAGGVFAPLLLVAAAIPLLAIWLILGRLVGTILADIYRRLGVSAWIKAAVLVVVLGVAFVGMQLFMGTVLEDTEDGALTTLPTSLPGEPIQAYGSLFTAPLGSDPGLTGVAVLIATLAAVPVALVATLKLETARLVRDGESGASSATAGSRGVPSVFDRSKASRVAWRHLLRTYRDPKTLSHLAPMLFGLLGLGGVAVADPGILLTLGPGMAVVMAIALAGGAYCLNPLGDDRNQLPLLLTSTASVRPFLRGRAIAGLALAFPLLVAAVAVAAVEFSVRFAVALVPVAGLLAVAATGVSLGLGGLFPQFEASEYMNVERSHPSMWVIMGHFFGSILFGSSGVGLLFATVSGVDVSSLALAVGWAVYAALVVAPALVGYIYAVRRFDRLTLDHV